MGVGSVVRQPHLALLSEAGNKFVTRAGKKIKGFVYFGREADSLEIARAPNFLFPLFIARTLTGLDFCFRTIWGGLRQKKELI